MDLPIWQASITDGSGDIEGGAAITIADEGTGVYPAGGTFEDRAGATPYVEGSIFADGNGFFTFYALPGEYRVTAVGVSGSQTFRYIVLPGTAAQADLMTAKSDLDSGKIPVFPWAYVQDNILGTVSESAGVPTGAIIERGSNANGEFVKFADGTLICTHISSATGFNLSASSYFTWTFPHAFLTTFNGVGYIQRPSNDTTEMFVRTGTVSTGSAQNFAHSGSAVAGGTFILRAIGRWF